MLRNQVLPEYHLIQRKRKTGKLVLYAGFKLSDGSARYSQMIQLRTEPATKGARDKARRDREAHAELLELHAAGKVGVSSSLAEYLDTFWDYERSEYVKTRRAEGRYLSPPYCANSRALIRDYFLPYMEYRKISTLSDLTKQVCLQWRNHLFENGRIKIPGERIEVGDDGKPVEPATISSTTVNKVRQAVHVALEHAENVDLIAANPMRSIRRVKENPVERKIFERDELVALFSRPWPDIRAFAGAMLAAATGMRLGEIRGLLRKNVHFDNGYLDVLTSYQDTEGIKPPKWNDIRYGIPLPGKVADSLEAVLTVCPYTRGPEDFLFFGEDARRPVAAYTLQHGLKVAMESAEIPARGRTFHCLRHTAASLIAGDAGMDRVQRLLGHTTARMTENYTHPDRGRPEDRATRSEWSLERAGSRGRPMTARHWLSESIIRELPRMLPRLSDAALRTINEIALADLGRRDDRQQVKNRTEEGATLWTRI